MASRSTQASVGSTAKPFTPIVATAPSRASASARLRILRVANADASAARASSAATEIVELAYERATGKRPRAARSAPGSTSPMPCSRSSIADAQAASDDARAIGRHGLGRAAEALLSAASAEKRDRVPGCSRTRSLESVIYAGEAHSGHLAGSFLVNESFDAVSAAPDDADKAVRFRRGYYLGDGTGAGKGRQVAGVVLDNWLKGRRKALWISKSDKLIEDAQRDWAALGPGEAADRSAVALQAGRADQALRRHSLHDLCHPALG